MRALTRQGEPGAVTRLVAARPERVYAVLADGWSYPLWVVGAAHMRCVDPGWPSVGTCLHHSFGVWPALVNDTTEVVEVEPDRRLVLDARARPTGAGRIEIDLRPHGEGTMVVMREWAVAGPARLVPLAVQHLLLAPRNREALARLDAIARNREG